MSSKQEYIKLIPVLQKELNLSNITAVPRLLKIVINIGLGEALTDKKVLESMSYQLSLITGQKPAITRSKKAIAAFKLRANVPIGLKVTLRGKRMWDFYEKLVRIVLPRVRDFRGISYRAMDGKGNLNIGFSEILVFPEVDFEKLDKIRGLQVTIATNADTNDQGIILLKHLGMPFEKIK